MLSSRNTDLSPVKWNLIVGSLIFLLMVYWVSWSWVRESQQGSKGSSNLIVIINNYLFSWKDFELYKAYSNTYQWVIVITHVYLDTWHCSCPSGTNRDALKTSVGCSWDTGKGNTCQSHPQQPWLLSPGRVCFWSSIDSVLKQAITYFNQPYQNEHTSYKSAKHPRKSRQYSFAFLKTCLCCVQTNKSKCLQWWLMLPLKKKTGFCDLLYLANLPFFIPTSVNKD